MFKGVFGALGGVSFLLQTILASYPAGAKPAFNERNQIDLAPPSVVEALLAPGLPKAKVFGIDLLLSQNVRSDLTLRVRVECVGAEATPPLALDAKTYARNARLINLTGQSGLGCKSYDLKIAQADNTNTSTVHGIQPATLEGSIAVGVAHPPIVESDGLTAPSVFVFNPVHGNWTNAKSFKPAQPEPKRVYATLTENHQRIISGIIAVPEKMSAEPAQYAPSTVSDPFGKLDPAAGYLSLGRLAPDAKGAFSQPLPLSLRPARGPGPRVQIVYSSHGAAGVLGRGWDLKVSSITVRGPAPIYHPGYETEDYLLDDEDLIAVDAKGVDIPPLYKGGPIVPRIEERLFRLRNNSNGLIIHRFGRTPNDYLWLIWDPHAKVTRLYGGHRLDKPKERESGIEVPALNEDGNGLSRGLATFGGAGASIGKANTAIGEWGLTQEYDNQPARNGVAYFYGNSNEGACNGSFGAQCSPALRLEYVVYNLAFAATLDDTAKAGVTLIDLQWRDRDLKRFNTDGRLGYFRAFEFWLSSIEVRYAKSPSGLQLASTQAFATPDKFDQIFSSHAFNLTGDDGCTNHDMLLTSYTVENAPYDVKTAASQKSQTFTFEYEGKVHCNTAWPHVQEIIESGDLPDKSPATSLGFPAKILDDLDFDLLTGKSILGTGQSEETGSSHFVGVGPADDETRKPIAAGYKSGDLHVKNETGSTLADVTGDGIDDIVYRKGQGLRYCAGVRDGKEVAYPASRCGDILGITELGKSNSETDSSGFEGYAGPAFGGIGHNDSSNETPVYFTDRDGDGLIDLAAYGTVFYGLGESPDRKTVSFAPRKPLIPPIPVEADAVDLAQRIPEELEDTVVTAGAQLANATRKLGRLEYSQTTLSWEAPLDGRIRLSGSLKLSEPKLGYRKLNAAVQRLEDYYKSCTERPQATHCHAMMSDPDGAQYDKPDGTFDFFESPEAFVQIALSKKSYPYEVGPEPVECARVAIKPGVPLDLESVALRPTCGSDMDAGANLKVETGDVLYLTYSVDPDLTATLQPDVKVDYLYVEGDAAFNFTTGNQPDEISPLLNCGWADQGKATFASDCLLRRQTRYTFDLNTGTLTSAPGRSVLLRAGTGRSFAGKFEIPTSITRDYQVFLDVFVSKDLSETTPPSTYPLLFRQNVSVACAQAPETCTVEIKPECLRSDLFGECAAFFADNAPTVLITSRLSVEHKSVPGALVRNISSRLNSLRWLIPPHITSVLTEVEKTEPPFVLKQRPPEKMPPRKEVKVYLPIEMGEEDIEYARVEQGDFLNPNPELNETPESKNKDRIDFRTILNAEDDNVKVARARQTSQLCSFAWEILEFLRPRYTPNVQPFAEDYISYWNDRYAQYRPRCWEAGEYLDGTLKFTTPESPDFGYRPRLNLPHLLRNLTVPEQISSAETLLERVFRNLELPRDLLIDNGRLTRRGYRLPVKVNPLGCDILTATSEPVDQPIFGPEPPCRFRLLANFALLGMKVDSVIAALAESERAAFNLELTATINGVPVTFKELTRETINELTGKRDDVGNLGCKNVRTDTCLGNYGSFDRLEEHLFPDNEGDMFQRIVTNRRSGRAVAFSDDVMDRRYDGVCIDPQRPARRYPNYTAMEAKQDCDTAGAGLPANQKYVSPPTTAIVYPILENNLFRGRNRVLEFEARALDVLELHLKLKPVEQQITVNGPAGPYTLQGNFSIAKVGGVLAGKADIRQGEYLIPRSPSDLLSTEAPDCSSPDGRPGWKCRPWNRLGWAEILLGAQYRTHSDAHMTINELNYSILRRRDLLRLHPEIEVDARQYNFRLDRPTLPLVSELYMNPQGGARITTATSDLALDLLAESRFTLARSIFAGAFFVQRSLSPLTPTAAFPSGWHFLRFAANTGFAKTKLAYFREVYLKVLSKTLITFLPSGETATIDRPLIVRAAFERTPNVAKIGADWSFFAAKHGEDGILRTPLAYSLVRYNPAILGRQLSDPDQRLRSVYSACGGGTAPDYRGCRTNLADEGASTLNFDGVDLFPLMHHFVGPTTGPSLAAPSDATVTTCSEPTPSRTANCWSSQDDTVFFDSLIDEAVAPPPVLNSVSALIGFERPPVSRFKSEYEALCKVLGNDKTRPQTVCADENPKGGQPEVAKTTEDGKAWPQFPNRPLPAPESRIIEVFAPIQRSESETVSLNGGIGPIHANKSWTAKATSQLFLDVNGDGYPETISNGLATLTSPVGLSRKDWWRFFRVNPNAGGLGGHLAANGYDQNSMSDDRGIGTGITPATFAKAEQKATDSNGTGSPNAKVDPGFDFGFERGEENLFSDLKDFNGDGLADEVIGSTVSSGLRLRLNAGNRLRQPSASGTVDVGGQPVGAFRVQDKYNISHGAGFGVRLGYSYASDSFVAGMGLSHRDNTSEGALIDFTGDGRVDIVLPASRDGTNYLAVFPNLGNGFGPAKLHEITGWENSETSASETTLIDAGAAFTFGVRLWFIKIVWNPGKKHANGQTRELVQIRDMNADGAPDIATVSGRFQSDIDGIPKLGLTELKTRIHHNPDARYHLLSRITEPSGARYFLGYDLFGNTGPEHGSPVWALTSVGIYDGYEPNKVAASGKLAPDGQDVDLTFYHYAKGYYNRAERQFYGFAERTVSKYGCDLAEDKGKAKDKSCIGVLEAQQILTEASLAGTAYRELQEFAQSYSNRDYLTQGTLLAETVLGAESGPMAPGGPADDLVSHSQFGYSIDDLAFLKGGKAAKEPCELPADGSNAGWSPRTFDTSGSKLSDYWNGTLSGSNGAVFGGANSLCKTHVAGCDKILEMTMCRQGFAREQAAFWAQQSGSVRQRFSLLQAFGNGKKITDLDKKDVPRLASAVAFDHDQWGQVLGFNSIGELRKIFENGEPVQSSSVHAKVVYKDPKASDPPPQNAKYPLLDLPESVEIYADAWQQADSKLLRVRESLYADDRTGNLTDVCIYPGGEDFTFKRGICQSYKKSMQDALQDRYSTVHAALRKSYDNAESGLPKGGDRFSAIIHYQAKAYDAYGNLLHAISPLSEGEEWIERRFDYSGDPFLISATTTELTRCVEDVPGAGKDSAVIPDAAEKRCAFGLPALNEAVVRRAITHASYSRIDRHFGTVAETRDINGNSLLYDYDRWGRLRLLARGWGKAPRENRSFADLLDLAIKKSQNLPVGPIFSARPDDWRLLAIVDYDKVADGQLRSNVRQFEPSDSYNGLIGTHNATREKAAFADGLGQPIQNIQEADVCLEALPAILDGKNPGARADLAARCDGTATALVMPAPAIDALGRELQTFESYPAESGSPVQTSDQRFTELQLRGPKTNPKFLAQTVYDGAGRALKAENRLSKTDQGYVLATAQYRYHVLEETEQRGARFESLSLSPRCTASSIWADARGQTTNVFENQTTFFGSIPSLAQSTGSYRRDYDNTLGKCSPVEKMEFGWIADAEKSENAIGDQPSRVSYVYDPLRQLTAVDYPLDNTHRAAIDVYYDLFGRMTEMREANAGCIAYRYDGMQNLMAETASRYQPGKDKTCEAKSTVRNEKSYRYSAERLIEMDYRSLEEQGGERDQGDKVRFFYDRFPYAAKSGELIEALKFVPNDLANQRFVEQTGLNCENCIGKVAIVSDRSGARSQIFTELGLPKRELRSIVAPVRKVKHSDGESETYLPEIAFYEEESAYTAFGDLVQQEFSESAPMNPSQACVDAGMETCLARFTLGRKYAPDGKVAALFYNGKPLINAARDALGRSAVRWTADGTVTGFRYDQGDLRLNELATITAGLFQGEFVPVQRNGYQYDGGGNVLGYRNTALPSEDYESQFDFTYDPVNRLKNFGAAVRKAQARLESSGSYGFDAGHRFTSRKLTITGSPGGTFMREWAYRYGTAPGEGPLHAPSEIDFTIDGKSSRASFLTYDDIGRMTRIGTKAATGEYPVGMLSNRAMTWDAEGRLLSVRGVSDEAVIENGDWLREDYIYDYGANRTVKLHHPLLEQKTKDGKAEIAAADEGEAVAIYMTPYYSRNMAGRGTVQISEGSLPSASLSPSTDESEDPITTYLYSDLAVGSVSASVTVFGEVDDANAIVIGRREYSPFGLELTVDDLAKAGRDRVAPLSIFHGKELDRVTGFSSFGARSYSRDLGIWLSSDPMLRAERFLVPSTPAEFSTYAFSRNNPAVFADSDGMHATLASGAPNASVYRRIEYMAPYILTAATKHGVDPMSIAAIVYQEKYWGMGADLKDLVGVIGIPLRRNVPFFAKHFGTWDKTSLGPGEMQLKLAAELTGKDLNDPEQYKAVFKLLNEVPSAMDLVGQNIKKNQDELQATFTPKGAGIAHNSGVQGFKRYTKDKGGVPSRIDETALKNLKLILDHARREKP